MRVIISLIFATICLSTPINSYAKAKKLSGVDVVDIADISITLNGLVCDFCSIALNKTFKKHQNVRGTYINLDSKIMSVALIQGTNISNEEIIKLVKKAGYSTLKITRKDGSTFIPRKDK